MCDYIFRIGHHSSEGTFLALADFTGVCVCVCVCVVTQLCLTLCGPVDCSTPGSSVRGILQARILEGIAIPFSRGIVPTQG